MRLMTFWTFFNKVALYISKGHTVKQTIKRKRNTIIEAAPSFILTVCWVMMMEQLVGVCQGVLVWPWKMSRFQSKRRKESTWRTSLSCKTRWSQWRQIKNWLGSLVGQFAERRRHPETLNYEPCCKQSWGANTFKKKKKDIQGMEYFGSSSTFNKRVRINEGTNVWIRATGMNWFSSVCLSPR